MAAFSHLYVWRDRPLLELVEHIAQAYHEPHREQLARLCEITHELRGEAPFTGGIPGLVEAFEYLREELLQHMLSLTGSLSEARLAKLRPMVARIVEQLTKALAMRVRPALLAN